MTFNLVRVAISARLRPPIARGMKSQRATINDVARQARVSKATVSAVINDSATVKGSTRDRVLAAIDVLNYRPTQVTHAAARKTKSIGLLIKEIDNPYYAEIVLLRQPYVKDDKQTIEDVIKTASAQTGEKIVVRRFTRYALGE